MPDSDKSRPACERCRRRRVKCDRATPQCGQCAEANVVCEYKSRNAASIFMLYVQGLEAEVAQLEHELGHIADDVHLTPTPIIENTAEEVIVTSEDVDVSEADMTNLIESISKVSLSATTEKDIVTFQSHDLLTTLILSAAVPADFSHITACSSGLPPQDMVDTVLQAYFQKLHQNRPFITQEAIVSYSHIASGQIHDSPYAEFIIGVIIATTVVSLSPSSLSSSLPLYHFSVQRLAISLNGQSTDHLRELEAVIALATFAQSVLRCGESRSEAGLDTPIDPLLPDLSQLSALGMRIAVDHGLHKNVHSSRQRMLFKAAYSIEAETAKFFNVPDTLPPTAVDVQGHD